MARDPVCNRLPERLEHRVLADAATNDYFSIMHHER
jgi:hypothetical protein